MLSQLNKASKGPFNALTFYSTFPRAVKPAKLGGMNPVKKKDGIAIAGSAAKLARIFGVSRSAITQWGEWMPPYRVMQLKEAMPERFAQHFKEGQNGI